MKLKNSFFTFLILLLSFQICIAQEKPKPILVNEFEVITWSEFRGTFDNFLMEIMSTPGSKGYIVIYGNKANPLSKYYREILLKTHISARNFDENRLVFLYGEERESLKTQFWKAPIGADEPEFVKGDWNYKLPLTMKPIIIHQTLDKSEVGNEPLSIEFYTEFFPGFSKQILIHEVIWLFMTNLQKVFNELKANFLEN